VALVWSQLPARQLGPLTLQAAPTSGRSTQVPLVVSQAAYATHRFAVVTQGLPTERRGVQSEVLPSQWSAKLSQSSDPIIAGSQVPPVATRGWQVLAMSQKSPAAQTLELVQLPPRAIGFWQVRAPDTASETQTVPVAQDWPLLAEQSPPSCTVIFGVWQTPAQHCPEEQLLATWQVAPPTHSSLKKQAPPAATVPLKISLQAGGRAVETRVLRVHDEKALIASMQVRAEAPS
jgi:hypothetical protein